MRTSYQLSEQDLELQRAELLPAREALGGVNFADIDATNVAAAVNIDSEEAEAEAEANQTIVVLQEN